MKKYHFFIGAMDLEMQTIVKILIDNEEKFTNKNLSWSDASFANYEAEIKKSIENGETPVLIEIFGKNIPKECVIIDHHGELSHRPASIIQALELLEIAPKRHHLLVAANDEGAYFGLKRFGATENEIFLMRSLERAMMGITYEKEILSVERAKKSLNTSGIHFCILPFSQFAAAADFYFENGIKEFIIMDANSNEIQYQGNGDTVKLLAEKYPVNWHKIGQGFECYFGCYAGIEMFHFLNEIK